MKHILPGFVTKAEEYLYNSAVDYYGGKDCSLSGCLMVVGFYDKRTPEEDRHKRDACAGIGGNVQAVPAGLLFVINYDDLGEL